MARTQRASTLDRGPPGGAPGIEVHTVEQLSQNMSKLPNGALLCRNVPITRVGWLLYGPGEVPVKTGPQGVAYVERTADSLFIDSTINSINGNAVVNDHPEDDVTPKNWAKLSGGFALNARRGTGDDADVILADLMLTDAKMIAEVLAGKREVSWGYEADYRDDGGGIGRQFNLIGNHVALVRKGRCGPRCAIGDQAFNPPKETQMTARVKINGTKRRTIDAEALEALRQRAADAVAELESAEQEDQGEGQHIHVHLNDGGAPRAAVGDAAVEARFAGLESKLDAAVAGITALTAALATAKTGDAKPELTLDSKPEDLEDKDGDDDEAKAKKKALRDAKAKKTADAASAAAEALPGEGDSKALETGYTELMSQAEILAPGFKAPTFDAALTRIKTIDQMCAVRRRVLDAMLATPTGSALLKGLNGGEVPDTLTLDCVTTATLFKSAAVTQATINNAAATRDSASVPKPSPAAEVKRPPTFSEINAINAKFWETKLVK